MLALHLLLTARVVALAPGTIAAGDGVRDPAFGSGPGLDRTQADRVSVTAHA